MNMDDLALIGREISAARTRIPIQNRRKFDIEAEDHFNAIRDAVRAGDDDRAAALWRRWLGRVPYLSGIARCCDAPPCLVRLEDEPAAEYLKRCMERI